MAGLMLTPRSTSVVTSTKAHSILAEPKCNRAELSYRALLQVKQTDATAKQVAAAAAAAAAAATLSHAPARASQASAMLTIWNSMAATDTLRSLHMEGMNSSLALCLVQF